MTRIFTPYNPNAGYPAGYTPGLSDPKLSNIFTRKRTSSPWRSGYEWLDEMRRKFNQLPLSYRVLPDGRIEATRGGEGYDRSSQWILPKGAFTDSYNPQKQSYALPRYAPQSDAERQGGYEMGVSSLGTSFAMQNPAYFSPNAFQLPWRNGRGAPTPGWGTTTDYSRGIYSTPFGEEGRLSRPQTPPELEQINMPMMNMTTTMNGMSPRMDFINDYLRKLQRNRRY